MPGDFTSLNALDAGRRAQHLASLVSTSPEHIGCWPRDAAKFEVIASSDFMEIDVVVYHSGRQYDWKLSQERQ